MGCGTIRSDGLKADRDLQRGECDYRITDEGIGFYTWMDNTAVHLISKYNGSAVSSVSRTHKDGSKEEFPCPTAGKHYNQDMGGLDRVDMLCSLHGNSRKLEQWCHRIFFGLLDRTLVNAYVVFRKLTGQCIPVLDFHRSVAQELLTLARLPKAGRPALRTTCQISKRRSSE